MKVGGINTLRDFSNVHAHSFRALRRYLEFSPMHPRHSPNRRSFIVRAFSAAALFCWGTIAVFARDRPIEAFKLREIDKALIELFGTKDISESAAIKIGMADLAENGAVVPIKINADFDDLHSITILATNNPIPLIAVFELSPQVQPFVATRIRLAEDCEVYAVVETQRGLFMARKSVAVTEGGCGG